MGVETVLMIAGAAISAYGQYSQAQATRDAAMENANAQAKATAHEAGYAQDAATAQAEKIRRAGKAQRGEAKAALAGSGVKLGEGTALEIDQSIATNAEEDALSALLSGKRIAKTADDGNADMLRAAGKSGDNAMAAGAIGAGATVLGGSYKVAQGWKSSAGGSGWKKGAPGGY